MYIFGIDMPLVELFFVLTLGSAIFVAVFVYLTLKILQINRKLDYFLGEERQDLQMMQGIMNDMKSIGRSETKHLSSLGRLKTRVQKAKMPVRQKQAIQAQLSKHHEEKLTLINKREELKKKIQDYYTSMKQTFTETKKSRPENVISNIFARSKR